MLVNATYANCTRAIGTYKLVFVRIFFFQRGKKGGRPLCGTKRFDNCDLKKVDGRDLRASMFDGRGTVLCYNKHARSKCREIRELLWDEWKVIMKVQ